MPTKEHKGVRAPDSVQGNPLVRDRLMGMFEDGTITAKRIKGTLSKSESHFSFNLLIL